MLVLERARSEAAIASVGSRQLRARPRRPARRGDEAADPLGREVLVLDDLARRAAQDQLALLARRAAPRGHGGRGSASSPPTPSAEASTCTAPGCGKRSPPRSRCSRRRPARSGAGRDVQTSQWCSSVARRMPVQLGRPALGGVRPVLGRAERVVGDEQLRPRAVEALLDLLRPRALVHLPALGEQRQPEHPRDRGLAHLRRAGQDEEVVRAAGRRPRAARRASGRTRARARASRRCRASSAPARPGRAARRRARAPRAAAGAAPAAGGSRPAARPRRRRRVDRRGRRGLANVTTERGRRCAAGSDRERSPRRRQHAADQHRRRQRPLAERQLVRRTRRSATESAEPSQTRRVDTGVSFQHELTQAFELQPTQLIERGHAKCVVRRHWQFPPSVRRRMSVVRAALIVVLAAGRSQPCRPPRPPPARRARTCGRVTVPLDHSRRDARARCRSPTRSCPRPAPAPARWCFLSGGPGQAALPLTTDFAELLKPLRRSYDIVDRRPARHRRVRRGRLPARELRRDVAALRDQARRQAAVSATRRRRRKDLENLRVALGVDKLTLLGVSYGANGGGRLRAPLPGAHRRDRARLPHAGRRPRRRTTSCARSAPRACCARSASPGDCHATVTDPDAALARPSSGSSAARCAARSSPDRHASATESVTEADLYEAITRERPQPGAALGAAGRDRLAGQRRRRAAAAPRRAATASSGDDVGDVNIARLLATSCIESRLPWAPDSPVAVAPTRVKRVHRRARRRFAPFSPPDGAAGLADQLVRARGRRRRSPRAVPYAARTSRCSCSRAAQDLRTPLESARRTAAQYPNAKLLAVPGVGHSVLSTDLSGCARRRA